MELIADMELNREQNRLLIWYCFKRRLTPSKLTEEEVAAAAVAPVPKPRGSVSTHLRKIPLGVPQSRSARYGSRCFVCGSLGHLRRTAQLNVRCGEVGHLCKDCPRLTLNESRGPQAGPVVPKV